MTIRIRPPKGHKFVFAHDGFVQVMTQKHKDSATAARRRGNGLKAMQKLVVQAKQTATDLSAGENWGGKGADQVMEHTNGERKRKLAAKWRR